MSKCGLNPVGCPADSAGNLLRVLLNPWFLAATIACLLLAISLGLAHPRDEAIWTYSSWLWAVHGDPPYVSSFENKPAGIFLLYRLSYSIFGLTFLPPRVLGSLAMIGAMLLLYAIGQRYQGRITGAMAALIFGLTMIHGMTDGSARAMTETFMIFFSTGAFYLLSLVCWNNPTQRRGRLLFGAGAALGVALSFKQIAIFDVVGLMPLYISIAIRTNASIRSALFGLVFVLLGGCIATALTILPLLASGVSLSDYWNGAWGILLHQNARLSLGQRIELFAATWMNVHLMIVVLFAVYYLCNRGRLQKAGVPFWSLLFWLGMDFLGANASDMFGHQIKQVMAPLSLVAALGIGCLVQAMADSMPRLWVGIYVSLAAMLLPYVNIAASVERCVQPDISSPSREMECREHRIAEYIDAHTGPSDAIYVWDTWSHAIYVYAERRSSCRYFNTYLRFSPDFETTIASDLAARPPKLVLINNDIAPPPQCVLDYIARNCTPVCRIECFEVFQQSEQGQ